MSKEEKLEEAYILIEALCNELEGTKTKHTYDLIDIARKIIEHE